MKEETWFKMLTISTVLHFIVVGAFSIPIKRTPKRFDALSSYSVNLVGDIGGGPGGPKAGKFLESKHAPEKETSPARVSKPVSTPKSKPVPIRKEKEAVSLSKKKEPPKAIPSKETTTKEELSHLNDRIREMKKRTEYLDVTRTKGLSGTAGPGRTGNSGYGLPGSSEGGGRTLDPVSQRYMLEIWEKIKNSWGLPGIASYKKDLETIVTIRIRKDGRIVDVNIEKRSGNRIYDESILRVLRSVDPLPPIPTTLNMETMEIGFRFLPGDLS
ncbi:MAG: TonB family protein [Proteobacteria bacterium]|nr:TonB family protein [Pseudomonadota bacterium]